MAVQTISYTDKVALNENSSIADINKIKDDDMNEIKSVVNNNATETDNNSTDIENLQIYSTTETNTGKVWIDNKPIYRKVYEKQVSSNTTDSSIALLSDLGYETIWINQGKSFCQYGANTSSGINWYNGSSDYGLVYINPTGKLTIKNGSGLSRTYYVTVEYTKTS